MRRLIQWGPWVSGLALVTPILLAFGRLDVGDGGVPRTNSTAGVLAAGADSDSLDALAGAATTHAPFRPDGRPPSVAYDLARSEAAISGYAAPKPRLVLVGLLGGKTPMAAIEGIPGREGSVLLAVGDTLGGLLLRRISEGAVTVTGMDTTWVLSLRGMPQ